MMRPILKGTPQSKPVSVLRLTVVSNNLDPLTLRIQAWRVAEKAIHARAILAYNAAYKMAIDKEYTSHQYPSSFFVCCYYQSTMCYHLCLGCRHKRSASRRSFNGYNVAAE
jgi:hypothetical protein